MEKIMGRLTALFAACLLLYMFTTPAMGWPPPCPPCHYWDGADCENECYPNLFCEDCVDGRCKSRCDPLECEECNGQGGCVDGCLLYEMCLRCNGNDRCESTCDPNKCEECVNDQCKVCGGDPDKVCCDGSCCDKVWTKETHTAINESCPSVADCKEEGCDGVQATVRPSYDSCLNVGVGEGEHCECNEEMQVVGYDYTCQEDWDWSRLLSCAAQCVCCAFECLAAPVDPAACANCLAGLALDCCDSDPCHICDFLESCDPLYPEEIKKSVFINFGDCS